MARAWVCVAVLLLSACGRSEPGDVAGVTDAAAPVVAAAPDDSTETLLARAVAAMQAGRITRPVGGSALDLLVTLHGREPGNAGVQAALVELQPYVLLAGERAIASGDLEDAERLVGALAMFNPDAVPLPRLRGGLEQLRREVALAAAGGGSPAAAVVADPGTVAATDQAPVATAVAMDPALPVAPGPVDVDADATAAVPDPAPAPPAAPTVAAPSPTPATDTPPVLVRDAIPEYPLSALRRGLSGRVRLGFTVRADGSVADVAVLAASPEGVFEEAAIAAARRWRFEPRAAPVGTERALRFDLPRR